MFLLLLSMEMPLELMYHSAKTLLLLARTPYAVEKILTEKNLHQLSVKLGFQLLILRPSGLFGLPVSEKEVT